MSICTTRRRRSASGPLPRGFTLVEMMVVLAISSILVLMAGPNLLNSYRRAALQGEARRLYGAFIQTQGLATSEGAPARLFLDRANGLWRIQLDKDDDGTFNTVMEHPNGAEGWPDHVALGPQTGVAAAFPAPYNSGAFPHDAWCAPTAAGNATCTVTFDIDGRVVDSGGQPVNGAIMLHDTTGALGGKVHALVFVGATGDVRLFDMSE